MGGEHVAPRVVELVFPAHARYLVLARLGLAGVAPVARLDAEQLADLKLAVTETCANAVKHAYPDGAAGEVRVRIALGDGSLTVEVADAGRGLDSQLPEWDPDALREHGMGLSIVRSVVDDLEIDSPSTGGTVVRFTKRLAAV